MDVILIWAVQWTWVNSGNLVIMGTKIVTSNSIGIGRSRGGGGA